eukprot:m.224567 g.224567  ORF g.224567 m.224567 type:complete len:1783 (-) comp17292_c0_seq1:1619-6967(-)
MHAFIALAALLAVSTADKITVSPTAFTMDKDSVRTVSFSLKEPIICAADLQAECAVVVTLGWDTKHFTVEPCHVKWTADEWHQTRTLRIRALENFISDGSQKSTIVTKLVQTEATFYRTVDPDDIVVTTRPRPSAQCSGTGDPHYTTFDRRYWHVYYPGYYNLYSNTADNFQVAVRTHSRPARHCAFAAREDGDAFIVNACGNRIVYDLRCGSDDCKAGIWPKVGVNGGRRGTYSVTFKSGRSVWASTSPWYMAMYARAPGRDYDNGVTGICGNFNGNANDDSPCGSRTCFIHHEKDMWASQKGTSSLFSFRPYRPDPNADLPHMRECTYTPPQFIRPILTQPNVEDISDLLANAPDLDDGELTEIDLTDAPPPAPMTEADAKTACGVIRTSQAAVACKAAALPGFDIEVFVADCVEDLKETGLTVFIEDAMSDLQTECAGLAERDQSTWETDNNGDPINPDTGVAGAVCPEDCNSQGTCANATCTCNSGFTGVDCSISKAAAPTINGLNAHYCDTQDGTHCPKSVAVFGAGFWSAGANLTCRFTITSSPTDHSVDVGHVFVTDALFLGSNEVLCSVPQIVGSGAQAHKGQQDIVSTVQVATGSATISAQTQPFTWYDGVCRTCDRTTQTCGPNTQSCNIDGQCVRDNVHDSQNTCLVCAASVSPSTWTYSYASLDCHPTFDNPTANVKLVESADKDEELYCVDATNTRVSSDPNYKLTYNMTGSAEFFKLAPKGSAVCVLAAKDFAVNSLGSNFNNIVGITASDQDGNHAVTDIFFEPVTTNESPAFASDGYFFTVPEDAAKGTVIGLIQANDTDKESQFARLTFSWFSTAADHEDVLALKVVDGNQGEIVVDGPLDFERHSNYHSLVKVEDSAGQFHIVPVVINVTDVPEAPVDIEFNTTAGLSNESQVAENSPVDTPVANLVSTDPEGGMHTYTVAGSLFGIEGTMLVTKQTFDFEGDQDLYPVVVTSTDATSLSFTKTLYVRITNVNEAPHDIALTETVFSEDVSGAIAEFTFVDDDNKDRPVGERQTVGCSLADDVDGTFEVEDNQLVLLKPLDYETRRNYTIEVGCADDGIPVGIGRATFTLTIKDADDAPEDIKFTSDAAVPEDTPVGTKVGTLEGMDYDLNSTNFTMTLVGEQFATDGTPRCTKLESGATRCEVDVVLKQPLNFEDGASINIGVSAVDDTGAKRETTAAFTVGDVNEAPTGVVWDADSGSVQEGATGVVGTLTALDQDRDQEHTFTLVSPTDLFELVQDGPSQTANVVLKSGAVLDFETQPSITLTVNVVDNGNPALSGQGTLVLTVTDEPLRVAFTTANVAINEDMPVGSSVGTLELFGADNSAWTYSVSVAPDARRAAQHFTVSKQSGNLYSLVLAEPLDHESAAALTVNITSEATFQGQVQASTVTPLTVTVTDVDEAPRFGASKYTGVVTSAASVGSSVTLEPQALRAVDDDMSNIEVTYSIVSTDAFSANFQVSAVADGAELALASSLLNVKLGTYTIRVQASSSIPGPSPRTSVVDIVLELQAASGSTQTSKGKGADSTGMVVGVVVACLCLIILAVVLVVMRKRRPGDNFFDSETGPKAAHFDNPTFQSPSDTYAQAGSAPVVFHPGVSNPMYAWYSPDMTRQEATEELVQAGPGAFVVRDSKATPGWHILGVKTETDVLHEKICYSAEGTYQLLPANAPEQPRFRDLPGLVNHYGTGVTGLPWRLDTSSCSNPMYGISGDPSVGNYSGVAALANDPSAPAVPLKGREVAQVAQLADAASQDIYSNTEDAKQALSLA